MTNWQYGTGIDMYQLQSNSLRVLAPTSSDDPYLKTTPSFCSNSIPQPVQELAVCKIMQPDWFTVLPIFVGCLPCSNTALADDINAQKIKCVF